MDDAASSRPPARRPLRRLRGPSLKQNALPPGAKTAPMTSSAAPNIEDVAIVCCHGARLMMMQWESAMMEALVDA